MSEQANRAGEGSEGILRGEENTSDGKSTLFKLNQVVQVCGEYPSTIGRQDLRQALELLHESCLDYPPC